MGVIAAASVVPAGETMPERTFEAVAVADARRLYSLALSILRDEGEAEDAVQETLLKTWRSWESVVRMERPAAWLTRVCVNHCISRRRHLRSRGWPPLALIEDAVSPGDPGACHRPSRRRSGIPAALAQAAGRDHAQLPARLLGRRVRRLHGLPARNRTSAPRPRSRHFAKGARRWLTSIPDSTRSCARSSSTIEAVRSTVGPDRHRRRPAQIARRRMFNLFAGLLPPQSSLPAWPSLLSS